jgi:hypothetical protein
MLAEEASCIRAFLCPVMSLQQPVLLIACASKRASTCQVHVKAKHGQSIVSNSVLIEMIGFPARPWLAGNRDSCTGSRPCRRGHELGLLSVAFCLPPAKAGRLKPSPKERAQDTLATCSLVCLFLLRLPPSCCGQARTCRHRRDVSVLAFTTRQAKPGQLQAHAGATDEPVTPSAHVSACVLISQHCPGQSQASSRSVPGPGRGN